MEYINKKTKDGKVVKLKNYKRRALINRIKRRLFLFLFVLIILIFILLYAPFMQVKSINCYGNNLIKTEDIISSSQICKGNNIFRINKSKAISLIKENPYIKDVKISRKLPSTININIEECRVSAYIKNGNKYIYLNDECKILEVSDNKPKDMVPLVTGVNVVKCDVNELVEFKNQGQLICINEILAVVKESKFNGMVTLIDVKDTEKSKICVNDILDIVIGKCENLEYKINFMAVGAYDSLGENQSGILDVSNGSKAIFREKS